MMTKFHDDNSAKKSGLGKFLSGVSGVALLLGATYGTARGGTTIQGLNNFSVTNFGTTDFLIIDTGAIVFGNVTNSGTLGPSANPLVVRSGGIVTEGVVNTSLALITATATGIAFTGPLNDVNTGISNAGLINVAGTGSLNGIRITGSSVVTTISNAGTIKVSVTSASTSTASGMATGIHISGAGSLSAAITNSGLIDVDALMRASGSSVTAYADAAGINQFASSAASATSVALAVVNFATRIVGTGTGTGTTVTGSLDVFASAVATGSALASATAIGVHQTIFDMSVGSTASTLFINQGIVEVGAVAFASGSWADANADARGVWQRITGSADSASATFTNETSASFDVFATAIAKGTSSSASISATASAAGVRQTVSGGLSAAAAINNNGTFNVAALATAAGSAPYASAFVGTGFFQSASGTGGAGSTATALITNAGDINVLALAVAIGTNGASGLGLSTANAFASVSPFISQTARNAETLSVTFNNDGSIDVGAIAIASNAVNASASASIGTGIYLYAGAGSVGNLSNVATVSFSNSGSISFSALAAANGASGADASATLHGSVVAMRSRAETASASFVNSGTISAVINAQALATNGSASARVSKSSFTVFDLHANPSFSSFDPGSVATVSFSNSGTIALSALAAATGASGADASAAFGGRVVHLSGSAETASASFVNSGTISAVINAQALATSGSASAGVALSGIPMFQLNANSGFFSNPSSVATVSFSNSGTISFSALAAATGASGADASVTSEGSVARLSAFAETASASFVNSGTISAVNNAQAFAINGSASAKVFMSSFSMFALNASSGFFGNLSLTNVATVTFSNSGTISFSALAAATGTSGADAFVAFSGGVVDLRASGETASASFFNSGTLSVVLDAQAFATNGSASARFFMSSMFDLDAGPGFFGNPTGVATVSFTNSGSISLSALAAATGTSRARARVGFSSGVVDMRAVGETASASFVNSGTLSAVINAQALATSGSASARVFMSSYSMFDLDARTTSSGLGSVATVSFTNSGSISFSALATATGTSQANARVFFSSGGVVDLRAVGETASASFVNSGTLSVVLGAQALATNGGASADASMDGTAFELDALARSTSFGTSGIATVTFSNSGTISLLAQASAFGTSWASASATFNSEILDLNAAAFTATNTFTNSGTFNVTALAFASATNGWASADVRFNDTVIDQFAGDSTVNVGSSATVSFTNSGSLTFAGTAIAFGTSSADARASNDGGVIDQDAFGHTASATFTNSGAFSFILNAIAGATSGSARARASISSSEVFGQRASTSNIFGGSATATIINSGTFTIGLAATATGTSSADAFAYYSYEVIDQQARGDVATASINNSGTMTIYASAIANANNGWASADASFSLAVIDQNASNNFNPASTATASFANSGSMSFRAFASANGTSLASAQATFSSEIIDQRAIGLTANVLLTNSGNLTASALAFASATFGSAWAEADFNGSLIDQHASASGVSGSVGTVTFTNSGSMSFSAVATALGVFGFNTTSNTAAAATATLDRVAHQQALGETASVIFNNSGTFSVLVSALASAANSAAFAFATISEGISQFVNASQGAQISASATINNSGTINFGAVATAIGTGTASAFAIISSAFSQNAAGGATNTISLTNSGTINLSASAVAVGANALASASAIGAIQQLGGGSSASGSASFSNSGNFSVGAKATATNATVTESALANAGGYGFFAGAKNQTLVMSANNSGSLSVNATANGAAASAFAVGMGISGASVTGTIANSGTINVTASAPGGSAIAIGIEVAANVFNGTITNTGTIAVLAIGSTTATGIGFTGTFSFTKTNTVVAGPGDMGTITNDGGTLFAGVQTGTLDFGTVINTVNAPNPILINLMGSSQQGNIWGNILLSPDDKILVTNGNTIFRGMINGPSTFAGDMTIFSGGTLTLGTTGTGPSDAYLDNYTQTNLGTLAVNINPSAGTNSLGQINANVATLAGTLQVNVVAGLYANSQTYQDVVRAASLTGTWDNLTINTNTPLLSLTATYPGDGTVDLTLTRNPFTLPVGLTQSQKALTSPAGLTLNQNAAASGIENSFSTSLTGGYGTMIGEMFTFGTSTYIGALEQLHGAEYAQNLYSNLGSMGLLNYSIEDRLNAGPIASNNRQGTNIIQRGDMAIWARAQIVWGEVDGDIEAPGYDQTQKAFYAGLDYAVDDNLLIGFVAGYYDNELRFNNGNRKDDDGVQLGLYGEYDTQKFYLRGIGGYANYNADSVRHISFGSTVGTNFGNYDITVVSFMAETGRRFEISQDFYFTPYGGVSYVRAKNDAFTETGLPGSALAASSNEAKSFMSNLGARFTAAWDLGSNSKIIVEFGGAWQHEFKDDPVSFTTSFAGAPGSAFTVIGSAIDAETYMLNAGISLATGNGFEIKASYWGRFNSNFTEHSAGLRVIHRF